MKEKASETQPILSGRNGNAWLWDFDHYIKDKKHDVSKYGKK